MGEFQNRAELYAQNPKAWHPREILRWVEEAKKEYLNLPSVDSDRFLPELSKWFERWFGS